MQQAVDAADCDIPEAMIQRQIDYLVQNMRIRMMYQGLKMEDYLKYTNTDEQALRELPPGRAEQREDRIGDGRHPQAGEA